MRSLTERSEQDVKKKQKNYAIGYARRWEKKRKERKEELPNIMKYNALVLVLVWFGYIFIVSRRMGFVSV